MKKRIIGIIGASLGSVILSALLAFGIFSFIQDEETVKTGNVTDISWYNETDTEFTITTAEELYQIAELSKFYNFKGQTIKLGADIVVNEGNAADWAEKAPAKKWNPINRFAGTFDGQGHSISGLYGKVTSAKMALFTNTDSNCTIQNLKLVNTYFESNGLEGVASFVSTGGGKFYKLYSNAILECDGEQVAGIASMIRKQSKFEECWYDGYIHTTNRDAGGLVDEIGGVRVEMKHCLFSGTIDQEYTIGGTRTGAICGRLLDKGTLMLEDCLVSGKITASKTVYTGTLVGVVYAGGQISATDCYISSDTYHLLVGDSGEQGLISSRPLQMKHDVLLGQSAYEWTTLDFANYWAAIEGGTPVLKCFGETGMSLAGVEKAFDVSWYQTGTYSYELTTLKQLYGLYILSGSNNFAEHTIKLGADIVVNEGNVKDWEKNEPQNPWFPINSFAGMFDGQGHTISGIYLKNNMTYQGLFAQVQPTGILKNFKLKNSYFCNDSDGKLAMLGSIAGEFRGKLDNVYSDAIVVSYGTQVGGIFGRTNDNDSDGKEDSVIITNSWFDGELRMKGQEGRYGGGFVGMVVQGDLDISHCLNTGICSAEAVNTGVHLGGFIGQSMNGGTINMTDCLAAGKIEVAYRICVGSVFGRSTNEERTVNLKNVYATKECYDVTFFGAGEGGSTTAVINGGVMPVPERLVTGYNAYQWTDLDFNNYWAVVKDDTPILKGFANSVPSLRGYKKLVDTTWYQADKKTFVLKTPEQLLGFALLSGGETFEGKTIKLGADIVVNEGNAADFATKAPAKEWLPIGSSLTHFLGTFDGQGHTISGVYLDTEDTYTGLFGIAGKGSVIKNLKLTNSYFCYSGESAAVLGSVAGELNTSAIMENVYSDAIVVSNGNQAGGLVGRTNDRDDEGDVKTDKIIIRNCWYDGDFSLKGDKTIYGGGVLGYMFRGDLDMSHCLNTAPISSEAVAIGLHLGGLIGGSGNNGTLNLSDSLTTGKLDVKYHICVGSVIGRATNEEKVVNITNTYAAKDSYIQLLGTPSTATINGGFIPLPTTMLNGYNAYQWTDLDFASYWAVVENDTPVLKTFASKELSVAGHKKAFDLNWYQADKDTYILKTAEELRGFALISSADSFKGKTVKLGADIDLQKKDWLTIGSSLMQFAGTFDGQGHTVKGVKFETTDTYGGLFGIAGPGSTIKNFRLVDSSFNYSGESAAVLGSVVGELYGSATVENVYSNATVTSYGQQAGGLVGRINDNDADGKVDKATISNCWFDGNFALKGDKTQYGGGIVGRVFRGDLDMSHCLNSGSVSSEAYGTGLHLGGLVGAANDAGTLNLTDSLNVGTVSVTSNNCVGAILGRTVCAEVAERVVNIDRTYALTDSHKTLIGSVEKSEVNSDASFLSKDELTGLNPFKWAELDKAYWVAIENDTPELRYFSNGMDMTGVEIMFDTGWYNESDTTFTITTQKQLYGLAMLSEIYTFKDQTFVLGNNLDMSAYDRWETIGNTSKPFEGTFDGQMNTIKGIYLNTTTAGGGLFGQIGKDGKVANLYIKDSTFISTAGSVGSVAGISYGTISSVYSDADIVSSQVKTGGIVGNMKDTASVDTCWYAGDMTLTSSVGKQAAGIVGYIDKGNMNINVSVEDCLYTGTLTFEATDKNWALRIGGIVGGAHDYRVPTINLKDCISAGTITQKNGSSDTLGVSVVYGGFDGTQASVLNLENVYGTADGFAKARVYDKKVDGPVVNGTGVILERATLQGVAGYQNTNLDFVVTWAARTGDVPGLRKFVDSPLDVSGIVKPDESWYKAEETVQEIKDEADMFGFMKMMLGGNTFAGKVIYLKNDLQLNVVNAEILAKWIAGTQVADNQWIGGTKFAGTFDGQMHTISGIYLNTTMAGCGLFGEITATGVVKNLYIKDSMFKSTATDVGSVAGISRGTISTVYSDADIISSQLRTGGIVGSMLNTACIDNCWFDGEMSLTGSNGKQAGGIVGYIANGTRNTDVSITDCLYTGKLTFEATSTKWGLRIGGIAGGAHDYYTPTITIENCVSAGTITQKNGSTDIPAVSAVYGGFDEPRATILSLVNVYGTKECCSAERIYHQYYANESATGTAPTITGKGILKAKADLQGAAGYQNTLLDFEDTWVARDGKVPALKAFAKELQSVVDLTSYEQNNWYDANETVFGISSTSALKAFSTLSATYDFKNKTIVLVDDIEVNKVEDGTLAAWEAGTGTLPTSWTPIGFSKAFNGTFDGRMHTISGIYMKVTNNTNTSRWKGYGLFSQTGYNSTVKNFSLVDSYFQIYDANGNANGAGYIANMGSIAGYHHGYMSNVYSNAALVSNRKQVGGIMGYSNSRGVNGVWYDGNITVDSAHGREVGGIVGVMDSNNTFENILFTGSITFNTDRTDNGIGGIIGITYSTSATTPTLKNVVNAGTLIKGKWAGNNAVGSVVGLIYKATVKVENVYASTDFWSVTHNIASSGTGTLSGTVNQVAEANLYGDLAKTNASKLDYTNTWATRTGKVPALKQFID